MRRFFGRPLLSFVLQKVKIIFGVDGSFEKFFTSLSSLFTRVRTRVIHTLRKRNHSLSASIYHGRGRVDDDDDDDFVLLVEKIAPEQTRGSGLGRAGVDDRVLFSEQV